MSFAYAMLCDGTCDELVLIDINKTKADGEAMDLNHGLAFAKTNMKIYSGEYKDCADADIVVICAGVSQNRVKTEFLCCSATVKYLRALSPRFCIPAFPVFSLSLQTP